MQYNKQLQSSQIIPFLKQKDYEYKKEIGQGGLGRTILLRDPIVDLNFVCKKYSPENIGIGDAYFPNFIQEIRVLHLMHHKNIVRIFNYYLYPEQKTGYILMEHIEGEHIDKYILANSDQINNIFIQLINGFTYLEESNIVHRDIRPANILISHDGVGKIIDFGFGKKIETITDLGKSISLNWRYDPPNDFEEGEYTHATDIYFLGKLFEEIIRDNANISTFIYRDILKKMIKPNRIDRYERFIDIQNDILAIEGKTSNFESLFSSEDKYIYQSFVGELLSCLALVSNDITYISDSEEIYNNLHQIYKNSILEDFIYNMSGVIYAFIKGDWRYYPNNRMKTSTLGDFIKLLQGASKEGQKIILDHLRIRISGIDKIKIETEATIEDVPF